MENTNKKVENQNQNKSGKDEVKMENSNKVVKLNETQETVQEIREITSIKSNINNFDLEIAKAIVDGTVKRTELKATNELEKAKLENEASKYFKEVEERLEMRRMELAAKHKIVKEVTDTAAILGVVGAIAACSIMNTQSNNGVKMKKMELGIID